MSKIISFLTSFGFSDFIYFSLLFVLFYIIKFYYNYLFVQILYLDQSQFRLSEVYGKKLVDLVNGIRKILENMGISSNGILEIIMWLNYVKQNLLKT